jgi:hypothetical protein
MVLKIELCSNSFSIFLEKSVGYFFLERNEYDRPIKLYIVTQHIKRKLSKKIFT